MCLTLAVGLLLLVMLAGYVALIKAYEQTGKLKVIGQIISWIVIVSAFLGMLCSAVAIHCPSRKYAGFCKKGAQSYQSKQCSYPGKSRKDNCPMNTYRQGSEKEDKSN